MLDLSAAVQGFLLALGLFICPGPNDVLVFREALLGRSRAMLVAISSGSDLVLIAVGVLGVSALLESFPPLQVFLQVAGSALLIGHALHAALPRLCPDTDLRTQIERAIDEHEPERWAPYTARIFGLPGEGVEPVMIEVGGREFRLPFGSEAPGAVIEALASDVDIVAVEHAVDEARGEVGRGQRRGSFAHQAEQPERIFPIVGGRGLGKKMFQTILNQFGDVV